jgi:hypothetical protein
LCACAEDVSKKSKAQLATSYDQHTWGRPEVYVWACITVVLELQVGGDVQEEWLGGDVVVCIAGDA